MSAGPSLTRVARHIKFDSESEPDDALSTTAGTDNPPSVSSIGGQGPSAWNSAPMSPLSNSSLVGTPRGNNPERKKRNNQKAHLSANELNDNKRRFRLSLFGAATGVDSASPSHAVVEVRSPSPSTDVVRSPPRCAAADLSPSRCAAADRSPAAVPACGKKTKTAAPAKRRKVATRAAASNEGLAEG